MARDNLALISKSYQALMIISGLTLDPPFAALVLRRTRKPTTLMVGRLHYSLGSTLSAHFRWSFCASERLNVAS